MMALLKKIQNLKNYKLILLGLLVFHFISSIRIFYIHWEHYKTTPWYFLPFTPICLLISCLIFLCFLIYYFKKDIPDYLVAFTFMMTLSYSVMGLMFYPLYAYVYGVSWSKIASWLLMGLFFVEAWMISDKLKRMSNVFYVGLMIYFGIRSYLDYFLNNFYYFKYVTSFPLWLKNFCAGIVVIQVIVLVIIFKLSKEKLK